MRIGSEATGISARRDAAALRWSACSSASSNVSEGRDMDRAARDRRARAAPSLVDVHADPDHHRSVFTLAGPGPDDAVDGAAVARGRGRRAVLDRRPRRRASRASARSTSCRSSRSAAPRSNGRRPPTRPARSASGGPSDVRGPGVPLRRRRSRAAATSRRTRDDAFRSRAPDFGPAAPAPAPRRDRGRRAPPARRGQLRARDAATSASRAGSRARCASATAGCRACARSASSCPSARPGAGVDEPRRPRPHRRAGRVPARARPRAPRAAPTSRRVELVGLVPRRELDRCSDDFLQWSRHRRGRRRSRPASAGPALVAGRPAARPRADRRRSGAGEAAPGERPLAADAAALPLGHATPDPELLAVAQRVLEALGPHLAAAAHRLRLLGGGAPLGEEQVGVDPEAVGTLLPTPVVGSTSSSMSISRIGCPLVGSARSRLGCSAGAGAGIRARNAADGITAVSSGNQRTGGARGTSAKSAAFAGTIRGRTTTNAREKRSIRPPCAPSAAKRCSCSSAGRSGRGPSGNTWPRWAPQLRHRASVRTMPWLTSVSSSTASGSSAWKKLGQPVPDSNLVSDENSGAPQQTHS